MMGLSQQQLAKMIGVTYQQAHKYERGLNRISAGRLFEIGQVLGIPVSWFFEGLGPDAAAKGVRVLATFDTDKPLTSGWAWGQELLKGGVAMAEAKMGKGTLWLFGPEILFRTQPHGTYKLFLNALDGGFQRPAKPLQ
jgi:transcriptional regulator with XRE-family HTH domain